MSKAKDLTGQRFGRLVALEPTEEQKNRRIIWKCVCDCGNICFVSSKRLLYGDTQSCGCLRKERVTERISKAREKVIKHNMYTTRLYKVFAGMKDRCYNPNNKRYKHYGGRGITVCDEWRDDFQAFHDWAMANGYDENAPRGACTLDRIDVDGNYCPENCRWVDMKTQANNRRKNKTVQN
ncbi:MAG: hypothetical protein IKB02_09880 [Clostridia bacterium]|nr:hypothetical protein [Clostridia bacterium]MBR2389042.1 hypothetical protein [Clostridia bacterium]